MDTKTIIEICTSIISTMSVIITLGITIYFQFENRKRTIKTELYKELEKIWNKYHFFLMKRKIYLEPVWNLLNIIKLKKGIIISNLTV
ncbi:MAG: hypothetical protein H9Q67_05290, partial [Spiroplasma ixodetis]|nr:hypothetical protein [Spiroplasma ixodetis]